MFISLTECSAGCFEWKKRHNKSTVMQIWNWVWVFIMLIAFFMTILLLTIWNRVQGKFSSVLNDWFISSPDLNPWNWEWLQFFLCFFSGYVYSKWYIISLLNHMHYASRRMIGCWNAYFSWNNVIFALCFFLVLQCSSCPCQLIGVLQSVGFIGLGNMGSRMANNLIKNGYKVAVHDM